MPAWSTEIANEFIRLAAADGRALNQLQLQGLVYIAHGWRLAFDGEPLTGDRPEAWDFGPEYRRLADALAPYGLDPVTREITNSEAFPNSAVQDRDKPARAALDEGELVWLVETYQKYGHFESFQLSAVTHSDDSPWAAIYGNGAGKSRDIPHNLVKAQFVELLREFEQRKEAM